MNCRITISVKRTTVLSRSLGLGRVIGTRCPKSVISYPDRSVPTSTRRISIDYGGRSRLRARPFGQQARDTAEHATETGLPNRLARGVVPVTAAMVAHAATTRTLDCPEYTVSPRAVSTALCCSFRPRFIPTSERRF